MINKRLIPSQDVWTRESFIHARYLQFESCKDLPPHPLASGPGQQIIIEPDDDILCDSCGTEVLTPTVHLVEFGRRAVCEKCWQTWYQAEPVKYRRLREDGGLGEYVKIEGKV